MNSESPPRDVIVIGGGVIGLSIAWELAQHGVSVRVLEQGSFGQEASWAGAGMLPPGNPAIARTLEARLRGGSHVLWPDWSERLRSETRIDNGFFRCGGVEVTLPGSAEPLDDKIGAWQSEGVTATPLNHADLHQRLPALNEQITSGYFLPELGQVRNPRHLKALYQTCQSLGVDLVAGSPVVDFVRKEGRIAGVQTAGETHVAAEYIVASGAWSGILMQRTGLDPEIEPVRGQIVLLQSLSTLLPHVIEVGTRYMVPRPDGRILIGSTEERVGFEKRTTVAGVAGLIELARQLVPSLADARFERCWSGLRPHAPGGLPRIGRVPGYANLSLAAGHFRAGLQLSPITAVLMRQTILGQPVPDWSRELLP